MVKRAHLVTGKGGVGKSLVSAVLARHLSQQNQQILLAELNEHSFFKDYLNLPEISYRPRAWKPGVDISQWKPEDTLREYALHLLKIESLYKLFFENPVSKSLIQVAPGLQELALLGKLTSSPRRHGPPMNYDQIVVDAHATGHFLSLLRAPAAMREAVPFGPMGEQSRAIDELLRDPDFTRIHLVILPEELPVTEGLELFEQLRAEFGLTPRVYLNKISGLTPADLGGLTADVREPLESWLAAEEQARTRLRQAGLTWLELPLVTSLHSEVLIASLLPLLPKGAL